jgi:prepilin-type N-terminal cleavage/methylation domain-containing protein
MLAKNQVRRGRSDSRQRRGFTLLETLIVVAIMGIIMAIGIPNLMAIFRRAKLTGMAQETVEVLRRGRYEAIRRSANVCVAQMNGSGSMPSRFGGFVDIDGDCIFDSPEDQPILGLFFDVKEGTAWMGPAGTPDVTGFPVVTGEGRVGFAPNGVATIAGAFRIGMLNQTADPIGQRDYLEVRLPNANSGKIEVRKYNHSSTSWFTQDEQRWTWYAD